jgi:hypothetical protein
LQSRDDHREVEHPADSVLGGNVAPDVVGERIAVWEHAAKRQERSGHAEPGIAQ